MIHLYFIILFNLFSYIISESIITIPLTELFTPFRKEPRLYCNITNNYQVYLKSDEINSFLSITPFLNQFLSHPQPKTIFQSQIPDLKIPIEHYSLPLKLFNLNISIPLQFESYNYNITNKKVVELEEERNIAYKLTKSNSNRIQTM